jgi:hypothetical protein
MVSVRSGRPVAARTGLVITGDTRRAAGPVCPGPLTTSATAHHHGRPQFQGGADSQPAPACGLGELHRGALLAQFRPDLASVLPDEVSAKGRFPARNQA